MILPDDPPKAAPGQKVQPQSQAQPQEDASTSGPPPAYPGYSSYQRGQQPELHSGSGSGTPIQATTQLTEPAGTRFIRAFAVAALIYVLLGLFTSSLVEVGRWNQSRRHQWNVNPGGQVDPSVPVPWPITGDGRIIECHHGYGQWDHADIMPVVTLDMPLSGSLSLFSSGILASGTFTMLESPYPSQQDVRVEIVMKNPKLSAFEHITVCKLERGPEETSVGIYTPHMRPAAGGDLEQLDMFITILIPQRRNGPVYIPTLDLHLPNFVFTVRYPPEDITFGSVTFTSSNAMVLVERFAAANLTIKTTNGAIWGNFNISDSLTLKTSNGKIHANATAYHNSVRQLPTRINMQTSNSAILSDLKMISTAANATRGLFSVDAKASNGPLKLQVPELPLDSTLNLTASTSNMPVTVALSPAYEGEFTLRTSNMSPSVKRNDRTEDPSGRGRRRRMYATQVRGTISGEALWGDVRREGLGNVKVQSTNREVVLDLS